MWCEVIVLQWLEVGATYAHFHKLNEGTSEGKLKSQPFPLVSLVMAASSPGGSC